MGISFVLGFIRLKKNRTVLLGEGGFVNADRNNILYALAIGGVDRLIIAGMDLIECLSHLALTMTGGAVRRVEIHWAGRSLEPT